MASAQTTACQLGRISTGDFLEYFTLSDTKDLPLLILIDTFPSDLTNLSTVHLQYSPFIINTKSFSLCKYG